MEVLSKLFTPDEIKKLYPLSPEFEEIKKKNVEALRDIFMERDSRFLLIIGPCSADREDAIIDYMLRLKKVYDRVKDLIFIVPRLYTNKPRTSGTGYQGMLQQPDPHQKPDIARGMVLIRKLHIRILKETGFSCADEVLYPDTYEYLSDLLSYVTIGARSVEDQGHRLLASLIDAPVGMKNPLSGDLKAMANAVSASRKKHQFIYRGMEVLSYGNPLSHGILRGYNDLKGKYHPNYQKKYLYRLYSLLSGLKVASPSVIIDTNHANSGKNCLLQPKIAKKVLRMREKDPLMQRFIKGLMIESYIKDGSQGELGDIYGMSITDPCLGWEKTEELILEIYAILKNNLDRS